MLQFGTPTTLAKFIAAAVTVLLIGGAAVALYFRRIELAIACSIVGGWSIMMFFEVLRAEIVDDISRDRQKNAKPQSLGHGPNDTP